MTPGMGLTTTEAPYIENEIALGHMFIEQPYELYSDENHESWRKLFARMLPQWEKYANEHFLKGISSLCLDPNKVPRLDDVNKFLNPLTGFSAKAVAGYVPAYHFFESIRKREFPTTITIRRSDKLDYLPEPDIFHDISGHVPMHTDPAFADTLVQFGDCAHTAVERAKEIKNEADRVRYLESVIKAMARFFWFTVEFGLMRDGKGGLKAYGSGLLSSFAELEYCVTAPEVQRYPLQLEWVINQYFEIDHFQPLLFIADSFDHVFSMVNDLEKWMLEGKLDNVQPGEPLISEADLKSFMDATV